VTLQTVYLLANLLVLPAWAALVVRPSWRFGSEVLAPLITPGAMAVLYAVMLTSTIVNPGPGSFGSLAGISELFSTEAAALTGWCHYLVTDVFIGAWALRESRRLGIRHAVMVPVLLLLLAMLPVGLLLYLAVRAPRAGFRIPQ
jgi:hypothetical protein